MFIDSLHGSSVAATFVSRSSSAARSASERNSTFRIYPSEESEVDHLVTKALVLQDFGSAVSLCLRTERYVDAILLCEGGPKLLSNPQNAYFEKGMANLHYLRLFHLITVEDLVDIVQNADLQEWIEIFVILCTFAKDGEFVGLAEQLSQRLKFAGSLRRGAEGDESRENASLTASQPGSSKKSSTFGSRKSEEEHPLLQVQESGSDVASISLSR